MRRLLIVLAVGLMANLAWAEPSDDLSTCRNELARVTRERDRAAQEATFYQLSLAQMLAEVRARLVETQTQLEGARQELMKARTKP